MMESARWSAPSSSTGIRNNSPSPPPRTLPNAPPRPNFSSDRKLRDRRSSRRCQRQTIPDRIVMAPVSGRSVQDPERHQILVSGSEYPDSGNTRRHESHTEIREPQQTFKSFRATSFARGSSLNRLYRLTPAAQDAPAPQRRLPHYPPGSDTRRGSNLVCCARPRGNSPDLPRAAEHLCPKMSAVTDDGSTDASRLQHG